MVDPVAGSSGQSVADKRQPDKESSENKQAVDEFKSNVTEQPAANLESGGGSNPIKKKGHHGAIRPRKPDSEEKPKRTMRGIGRSIDRFLRTS
jgi:hypothetical protein